MENVDFDSDVLIVGAGPVGKTIAIELARYGVSHHIIDKATGPKDISKAMILHARTQEVQELMGVLPDSVAQSKPMHQLQMHAYGKRIATIHAKVDSPHPSPLILGQDRTERILEAHLNRLGGQVSWQHELLSFTQDESGVVSKVKNAEGAETTIRTRYIVGAEGSNSVVRKSLNLTFEGGRYEGEQFIQADCKIRWTLPKGVSYLFLTSEGYMMVIEMPDDIVRVFISLPDKPAAVQDALAHEAGAAEDKSHAPSLEEIQSNLIRLSGVDAQLSDPTWLARYRTSHRYANQFRVGRAFIAGDAGHVHVPLGGQGMNTGIQDGFNLGWKLAFVLNGLAKPELLDSYHSERHPVAKALIEGTDKGYTTILHPSDLAQTLVRRIGPFTLTKSLVQTKLMETLEEIKIAYTDSPLSEDLGGQGPSAGERAPDAIAVRLVDCETVRIHELLQGTQWLLLILAGTSAKDEGLGDLVHLREAVLSRFGIQVKAYLVLPFVPQAPTVPEVTLIDAELFVHDQYSHSRPALYLIRPDGYIGFRGTTANTTELSVYLERVLVAGDSQ